MNTLLKSISVAVAIGWWSLGAAAQDVAPAPAAGPEAVPPADTADADAAAADKSKTFQMTIGGKDVEGTGGHGITITLDDDEDEASGSAVAGKVVDRVVDDIEKSLARLPEDVRRDIDADDMRELRRALADVRAMKRDPGHDRERDHGLAAEMVPGVVAIVLLFGGPVLIVAIVSFNNRRKRQMVHETIDRIISQGKDVPVELLDALDKGRSNGKTMLSRGVVNIALGVGIGGMLYALGGDEAASLGLIPFCIGAAQLLIWKLEKPAGPGAAVS